MYTLPASISLWRNVSVTLTEYHSIFTRNPVETYARDRNSRIISYHYRAVALRIGELEVAFNEPR